MNLLFSTFRARLKRYWDRLSLLIIFLKSYRDYIRKERKNLDPTHQENLKEFERIKEGILFETFVILGNKREFLKTPIFTTEYKLSHISELTQFFKVEGEEEVVSELTSLGRALEIKKAMEKMGVKSDP